ncbi:MAG: hypothetical protein AAF441_29335 [Pseudomonadota bacterium]
MKFKTLAVAATAFCFATPAVADTVGITIGAPVSDLVISFSSGGGKATTCTLKASDGGSVPAGCNYNLTFVGNDFKNGKLRAVDNTSGQNVCTQDVKAACK